MSGLLEPGQEAVQDSAGERVAFRVGENDQDPQMPSRLAGDAGVSEHADALDLGLDHVARRQVARGLAAISDT
jgi:hypothetical protein